MKKLKAIILDDESRAVTNLQILITKFCPQLEVVLAETNPLKVISLLNNENQVDVLFIDISMGQLTGFDVVKLIQSNKLEVVFVTAHSDKAIEAIEYKPFGYLLKPIDIDQLSDIYNRLISETNSNSIKIRIPISDGYIWVTKEDILYIQAERSYSQITMTDGTIHMISKSMSWFTEQLDEMFFFKCHRSYIININKILSLSNKDGGFITLQGGHLVPIGKNKKQELINLLG
ncbi:MAG: two-component system LytT family response regulator [Parvicella sp.]|jgi:two-component system LytT family response regulator